MCCLLDFLWNTINKIDFDLGDDYTSWFYIVNIKCNILANANSFAVAKSVLVTVFVLILASNSVLVYSLILILITNLHLKALTSLLVVDTVDLIILFYYLMCH